MFNNSCKRGGDNDAGKHALIEVADQFLQRERYGGDGRVKAAAMPAAMLTEAIRRQFWSPGGPTSRLTSRFRCRPSGFSCT